MKTTRQSRQSSVISTSEKSRYPKCQRKKQHQKQSLSLICLSPHCKSRGLICVMCKSEHQGHNVQPLKSFLSKLEDSLKKIELSRVPKIQQNPSIVSEPNLQDLLERLQEQHIEMLSLLRLQIEEISEKVRVCEEEVMKEYNRIRDKVQEQFEKQTLIGKFLGQIQRYFNQVEREQNSDLKHSVNKLLPLLKIDKNQINIFNEAEKELNTYSLSAKTFKNNMLVWQRQTSNIITDIFKAKAEYQLRENIQRPMTAGDPSVKAAVMAFSGQFKTESVVIDKEGKNARVKDNNHGKIILLNQAATQCKNNSAKFKITGLGAGSSIQVGLCLKSQVLSKQYKFQKTNLNHGLFVLSSSNFIYSSGEAASNNVKGQIGFKVNDEITVEINAKEKVLVFSKKNYAPTQNISLKHVAETDWKQLYFCVSMNGVGDKVQLIG